MVVILSRPPTVVIKNFDRVCENISGIIFTLMITTPTNIKTTATTITIIASINNVWCFTTLVMTSFDRVSGAFGVEVGEWVS